MFLPSVNRGIKKGNPQKKAQKAYNTPKTKISFQSPTSFLAPSRLLLLLLFIYLFIYLLIYIFIYTTWIKKNCARIADVLDLDKITEP